MSPYEILGIGRDASKFDIERVYAKLARDHHPDRGGDRDDFEAIKLCYETLIDDAKRKRFDQTGVIGHDPVDTTTARMMHLITEVFNGVVGKMVADHRVPHAEDVRAHILETLRQSKKQVGDAVARMEKTKAAIEKCSGRFEVKVPLIGTDEESMLNTMVRQQIANFAKGIEAAKRDLKIQEEAIAFLDRFGFRFDKQIADSSASSRATMVVNYGYLSTKPWDK
jgi:curved DNA-binding protein CbpA